MNRREQTLKAYLDRLVVEYEAEHFIGNDPISVPHGFQDPRDQEVIGLFAALLAWGQRPTILAKLEDLCIRMDFKPWQFVSRFRQDVEGQRLIGFKHRTFKDSDAIWMCAAICTLIKRYGSVEGIFRQAMLESEDEHAGAAIQFFSDSVMSALPGVPARLQKHLARPSAGSACKRISMYLRWMVRPGPVDLGLWKSIPQSALLLPLDVHSGRQARAVGLLERPANDWKAAVALWERCRSFAPEDPCRYDFALFGAGVTGHQLDQSLSIA